MKRVNTKSGGWAPRIRILVTKIIIGKLGSRIKEKVLINIPSSIGPLKVGTNYLQA